MNRDLPTHRDNSPDDKGSDNLSLSGVPKTEKEINDTLVSIRYSLTRIDDRDTVHALLMVAQHPKLPEHARVFDLSHLVPEANRQIPQTLDRVIEPGLAMEERLTALSTIVNHFEADRIAPPISEQGPKESPDDSTRDELEPVLSFHTRLFTTLVDTLTGTSVRGVAVLRNNEPFLQFRVTETRDGHCSANLLVVPTSLELPLLDRRGHLVRADTADEALHDFTHLLYSRRNANAERLLRALGRSLASRQRCIHQSVFEPGAIPFNVHLLNAVNEMNLVRHMEGTFEIAPSLAPEGSPFLPRTLPDQRIAWIAHDASGPSSHHVKLEGHSIVGEPYTIDLRFPPSTFSSVRRAFHKLLRDETSWPSFHQIADILSHDHHSGVSLDYPNEISSYPVIVNDLIASLEDKGPTSCLRGAVPQEAYSATAFLPYYIDELVRGRTPLFMRIEGDHPASTWSIQAFFNEELQGSLFMRNDLCGRIILSTLDCPLDTVARKAELERVLQDLPHMGPSIFNGDPLSSCFGEQRANLPRGSHPDRLSYESANHAATVCLNAIQRAGYSRKASDPSWIVQHPQDGRWSVTLPALFSVGRALPYVINMQVGIDGVSEVAYSRGQRGPLGWLFGRRIFSGGSGPSFSDEELTRIISLICSESSRQSPMQEFQDLNNIRTGLTVLPIAPLRELDPEALQRDTLTRLWRVLRSLNPFPQKFQPDVGY